METAMIRRRAFTLVELLMVIAIMALLGTVTVGGYRAMQRGMEERGVMENANHFIRAAYRRAQIDRQPVAVYFWNETLREETETEPMIVVGRAVAVRRAGRVSRFLDPYLYDEFGDLDKERLVESSEDEDADNADSGSVENDNLVPLYKMNSKSKTGNGRSLVSQTTKNVTDSNKDELFPGSNDDPKGIPCYAYVLADSGTVNNWYVGDAYGLEFAEIQLPHGYLFGSSYHKRPQDKISAGDYTMMWFDVSLNSGSGSDEGATGKSTIQVYSLRPGKSGEVEAQSVATTDKPTEGLH